MRQEPYIDIDVHGMTSEQAIEKIESLINRANPSTYRIRVVHGFNRGNVIQRAIYREIGHGMNPKVLRIGLMNNIQACAREIVNHDIIYN